MVSFLAAGCLGPNYPISVVCSLWKTTDNGLLTAENSFPGFFLGSEKCIEW